MPLVPSASDSVAPVPAAPAATGAISSAEAARHLPVPGAQTSRPAEPRTDPDGWLESAVRSPEFWIRAAVVALAVFAFLIFVVVGLRALFSGDDGVERPETPTDLTSFPNPVERPLVAALPADLDCGRSPVAGPAVEAAVTCAGSIPISEVKLTSFGTTMGLDAYINSLDVVETAGGVTGSCAADGPADVHWQAVASERTGRLLCASTNGGAVLVWTETGRLEVGEARGTSVTELFRWWSAQVLGAEATELAPFPGPLEETLLSAIVPDGLGGNCSRYADVQPSVEASISCQGESPSRLFVDSITVGVSLDEYFASFRLPPIDSGSCSLGVAGNTVYLIDDIERGRVACIRRDGRTFIQWYDAPARVSGQAVFVDEGLADAYQWWLDNIAPGAVELVDFDEEAQAIVALGPPDVGENCGSRAVGPRADWISEVQCFPADENVESVTFLLFDDGAEAQAEYFVRIGEGAMELNTGDCFAGETGEQPVTDETADAGFDGRLGCQLRGGVAEVLRLDPDNAVLIRVVGANGDLSAVTDWSIR